MAGSFSIFLKVCPGCAGDVPTAAKRCGCGHVFEGGGNDGLTPEEQALRDEELYESYLLARVEQAHKTIHEAQFALAEDPRNVMKAKTAELAREAARSTELNLAEQRARVEGRRRAVAAVRPEPVAAAPPPAMPATRTGGPAKSAPQPVPPRPVATRTGTSPQAAAPESPKPAPVAAPAQTAPLPAGLKVAQLLGAIQQAKAREAKVRPGAARTAPPGPVVAPVAAAAAATIAAAPGGEVSGTAPDSFRQEQAARAERVLKRKLGTGAADCPGWDCPNCTARVPANTARCACGHAFHTGGTGLPSLSLGRGTVSSLGGGVDPDRRGN